MRITIRAAIEREQDAIASLVRSERMNPFDLDWHRFLVAHDDVGLAGTIQLRSHDDGSRELGSLVVRPELREHGIASRLIDAVLLFARGPLYMITGARFAAHYEHWGFAPVDIAKVPASIRRNYLIGRLAGFLYRSIGRTPNPLAILARQLI